MLYGHNYGARQLMRAAARALGRHISKQQVLDSMKRINPQAYTQRRVFADSRRTKWTLDHIKVEGEWWQTDLDCKLQVSPLPSPCLHRGHHSHSDGGPTTLCASRRPVSICRITASMWVAS